MFRDSTRQPGRKAKRTVFAQATLGDEAVDVGVYRPRNGDDGHLLIVFHGYERDAKSYLKHARRLARALSMTVIAPRFDSERFPNWRYQRAGVKRRDEGLDLSACIGPLLGDLLAWAKQHVGRPDANFTVFGHSAGGQMLSRIAAYCPMRSPLRIVIANPSSHVVPSLKARAPYGFRGAGDPVRQDELLRNYLAQPITIYLGGDDVDDVRLLMNRAAMRQGANRLERGRTTFDKGARIAARNGWAFNWRLVEAAGVGHSARDMLRAPEAAAALDPARAA